EKRIMRKHGMTEETTDALLDKIRDGSGSTYLPTQAEAEFLVDFFRTDPRFQRVTDAIARKYNIPPSLEQRIKENRQYYGTRFTDHLLPVVGSVVGLAFFG